jgi:hypothetical protein
MKLLFLFNLILVISLSFASEEDREKNWKAYKRSHRREYKSRIEEERRYATKK